jgi:hypothetical protein
MKTSLTRRHFLRAAGSLLVLPTLESMNFRAFAAPKTGVPPKRMLFLSFGWGVTKETWMPDPNQVGPDYTIPRGLAPLARFKRDFTVVQGCSNRFANEAHWGSTFWLTGANRYAEPGKNFHNSISVDQVAAAEFGKETRLTSLQLTGSKGDDGHGPGLSLSWDRYGKPMAGVDNPVVLFHKLFSDETTPLAERQAMLAQQRSVLDTLLVSLARVKRGLSRTDTDKLEEYVQGVRDIEVRLSKDEKWLSVPKAKAPLPEPKPGLAGKEEIKLMYDLMVAALQTDSTRVITYRQPVSTLLQSINIKFSAHDLSHYGPGERQEASTQRDVAQSELLAGLIGKLKSVKEADGSTLFDHTSLAYGSNIRHVHFLDNCPTILAGGGAGVKLGQHLVLPKDTPLCNVWLTLLRGVGLSAERHGDSSDELSALRA